MSPGRRIVLWRHGRTAWNHEGRIQGQADVPLDATGVRQARSAAPSLAQLGPALLVSSDLRRAADTAQALAAVADLAVTYDRALRERHCGGWEGLTGAEIAESFPEEHARWRSGLDQRLPGGESLVDAAARAVGSLRGHLAALAPGEVLVAATHGAVVRAVIGTALGMHPDGWALLGGVANGSWSVLEEHGPGWRLQAHNVGTALAEPARTGRVTHERGGEFVVAESSR